MKLLRGAWKLLVGIKDALVLIAMLLFFGALFAALSARPNPTAIKDGALLLALDGSIVEQPAEAQTFDFGGANRPREYRLRDLVRAIDAARDDKRVKAVVLDLDGFGGGYPAAVSEVASALGRVRAAGKPVLSYATSYTDSAYRLAANASEIWMDPMGGTLFMGSGGSQLYYKGLIDKLGVNVHVYRVGKFKSFVEPYTRTDQSPEAREASLALYGSLKEDWQQAVGKARPKAQTAAFLATPAALVGATNGDIAKANLSAGLIDKLGSRTDFNQRVAELAGAPSGKPVGSFNTIHYDDYLAANPLQTGGDAIGVVTVAGDIVDGKANPGTAGGDTIAKLVLDGLAEKKLKGLVVRIDSPGGSALASETIRRAILEAKAQKLPIVVSMGSVAASGGYWVATAGDTIFAEPNTITGSIGIFGIIPTFENSLKKIGITTDGVKTAPLSGQPDVFGGTNPEVDAILQAGIEHGYREFIDRVAAARKLTPQRVDEIAQGRVWDGGTARQIGLVDRFGTLKDAIAETARRAGLDPTKVHAEYLEKKPGWFVQLIGDFMRRDDDEESDQAHDVFSRVAAERRDVFAQALGDARRLATGAAVQARCLECAGLGAATPSRADVRLMDLVIARLGL
ncbi:MAG: signal peptide peptidase SppA [Sphingomonas sp. 28-66-16]|nr:MAG: signal peptide peptidase SppA [Sphingomonas sp. 28-66-16]